MAVEIKHTFQSTKPEGLDSTQVLASNWNAAHSTEISGGKVIGRSAGPTGPAEELPITVDPSGQSVILPAGSDLQRPTTALEGMIRYNTTAGGMEIYQSGAWLLLNIGSLALNLASMGGLPQTTDQGFFATGTNTLALFALTPFARTLLDDVIGSEMRGTLSVQELNTLLTTISALESIGFLSRTSTGAVVSRSVTNFSLEALFAQGITVTNGDGVAGNPIISARAVGNDQTWQDLTASRTVGTTYQNLTPNPIMVTTTYVYNPNSRQNVQCGPSSGSMVNIFGIISKGYGTNHTFIVPPNHFYALTNVGGSTFFDDWFELR